MKNVKDYGAIGNCKDDDTKAIQKAIDDVGIDNIYFPKGTYLVSSTLIHHSSPKPREKK